jgi:CBS domain-containing protein
MVSGIISEILAHKGSQLYTISAEATVFEAIQRMAEKNVGALLVLDGNRLLGVVSERDYTRKVALRGKSSRETKVREITSSPLITATPSTTVEECMRLMTEHRVRHLPVLAPEGIAGVVSIGDLVNWTIKAQNAAINQLEGYISGHYAV